MPTETPMQLGMVGLGRMGGGIVRRLMRDGHRCVGYDIHPDAVTAAQQSVADELGDHVAAATSQPYYLDITHPLANKGYVVRFLSGRYGIPPAEIATMGDGPNDVLMFAPSGLSIAMGNADPEVQRAATHVTATNDQDGFADAVERFILPERS